MNAVLASGKANPLSHPNGTQRPSLTNCEDATVTTVPSRHLPSTPITLAITGMQTHLACVRESEVSSQGRAGEEGSSRQPDPAVQCRCAQWLTTTSPCSCSASFCHFAFSPPASFQEPGPTAELIYSVALITLRSEWKTGSGEGEKPRSF